MKKLVSLVCGGALALSLFAAPGTPAEAAGPKVIPTHSEDDCECNVTPILGAEKNKIVANLLSSQEFKNTKFSFTNAGFIWRGADNIEVIRDNDTNLVLVGVPFYGPDGIAITTAVFIDGINVNPL